MTSLHAFQVLMLIIQMEKSTVFNSLLNCMLSEYSYVDSNMLAMRVMFLSGVSMVRPMMSHDVRFYMKCSTVFSPVNTIIQTRIVLRVLPDNQKTLHKAKR